MNKPKSDGTKLIAQNRRARYEYHLDDTYEAGIQLTGTEVKSLRNGKASLAEAWVKIDEHGEAWLMQCNIAHYDHAGVSSNHHTTRPRKLLLRRQEIDRLDKAVAAKGVTLVPTRLYFRNGRAKLEFAVGRGKNVADKRESAKQRTAQREIDKALSRKR